MIQDVAATAGSSVPYRLAATRKGL
jgi:hypothetical protein